MQVSPAAKCAVGIDRLRPSEPHALDDVKAGVAGWLVQHPRALASPEFNLDGLKPKVVHLESQRKNA